VPEAVSKRLHVASTLLQNGQTDKAIEFAAPDLNEVNSHTINFLSELPQSDPEAAGYIDVARLLRETERQRSLELWEDAVREDNRIEWDKPDRAVLLVGIANQLIKR
jgi:hypothetical protein